MLAGLVLATDSGWYASSWPAQKHYILFKQSPANRVRCEVWTATGVQRLLVGPPEPESGLFKLCLFEVYGDIQDGHFTLYRRPLNPLSLNQWANVRQSLPLPLDLLEGYCRESEMFAAPAKQSAPCRRLREVLAEQTMRVLGDDAP